MWSLCRASRCLDYIVERGHSSKFSSLRIRGRLFAGFAALCGILGITVGFTMYSVDTVETETTRMANLRVPVALTSTEIVGNLYASLATLRGYLLTGNPTMKQDRQGFGPNSTVNRKRSTAWP